PVRWLLRGCRPSRSCWYAFRDRLAPVLGDLNAQPLRQAVAAGLTPATRGACDGTLVAAHASRHRLVNEATFTQRPEPLADVVAAAQAGRPGEHAAAPPPAPGAAAPLPRWMALQPAGRRAQLERFRQAQEHLARRHARNRGKVPSKQTAPDKLVLST